MVDSILNLVKTPFYFESFEDVQPFFKKIIDKYKQMNYSEFESSVFKGFENDLQEIVSGIKLIS